LSRKKPAVIHRVGEGDVITDRTARTACLKAFGVDGLALAHYRFAAGETGADVHVHHKHSDGFLVIDGELTIDLGHGDDAQEVTLGPGDLMMAPPQVPHGFRNASGDSEAIFLNFHGPGAGFDDYMRALRDRRRRAAQKFDQHPAGHAARPAADAIVRRAGEGRKVVLGPHTSAVIRIGQADGIGSLAIIELEIPPGFPGHVPHHHKELLDSFWVLEGTLDLLIGEEWHKAGPGDFALVPPGNVHAFANKGDAPARLLNFVAPGGFENYLVEVSALMQPGAPPDPAKMAEMAARYDFVPAERAEPS
jgi:mannose-6-phosphate isomerase-like protein (cupin superfamily)